jgi:hypothetical protein
LLIQITDDLFHCSTFSLFHFSVSYLKYIINP